MSCIIEGFKKCGIYPFNPNATDKIKYSKQIRKIWTCRHTLKSSSTVTPDSTCDISNTPEIAESPVPAIEQPIANTPDLPNNSQYVVDSQMPSNNVSEDSQVVGESVIEFVVDPFVTT